MSALLAPELADWLKKNKSTTFIGGGDGGAGCLTNDFLTKEAIEIDRDRLYFVCLPEDHTPPRIAAENDGVQRGGITFCGTEEYVYKHFFADFGPLHVGHVYAFCQKLGRLLQQQQEEEEGRDTGKSGNDYCTVKPVYVYSSDHPHQRSNVAMLLLAYGVLCQGKTVEVAYAPFFELKPPLAPYRDASFAACTYQLEVLDCARALSRAASLRHLDMATFRLESYDFYDKIENGDINWIIPGKFLAFSGPLASRHEVESGMEWTLLAEDYVSVFRDLGVTCVIRFNGKAGYDRRRFTEWGFRHVDLFYEDGTNPSEAILQRFLRVCEENKGAIAVHCKAGLGRTGTNIALYMMKHYSYTAAESIALCRLCRPGSVVGPQQQFLHDMEQRMKQEGDTFRWRHRAGGDGGAAAAAGGAGEGPRCSAENIELLRTLFDPVRLPQKPHARARTGSSVGRATLVNDRTSTVTVSSTVSSPLKARRHSITGISGGGGGSRGGGGGIVRAIGPTKVRPRIVNRWVWGINPQMGGRSRESFSGSGMVGAAQNRTSGGGGRVGKEASSQHPRRVSSPKAKTSRRWSGSVVDSLLDKLRLSEGEGLNKTKIVEGRRFSNRTTVTGAGVGAGGSAAPQGKLVPLAVSLVRPATPRASTGASIGAPTRVSTRASSAAGRRADPLTRDGFASAARAPVVGSSANLSIRSSARLAARTTRGSTVSAGALARKNSVGGASRNREAEKSSVQRKWTMKPPAYL